MTDSDRESFREIFHLYFQTGRHDLARAVHEAKRILDSVSDPLLRRKAKRYVHALETKRDAEAAA